MNDNKIKLQNASLLLADLVRCEQWREVARVAGEMMLLADELNKDEYLQEARQKLHPIFAEAFNVKTFRSFAYLMAGQPEPEDKL